MQRGLLYLVSACVCVCLSVCLFQLICNSRLQHSGQTAIPTASVLRVHSFKCCVFLKLFCCKDRGILAYRGEVRHFCLPAYNYTTKRLRDRIVPDCASGPNPARNTERFGTEGRGLSNCERKSWAVRLDGRLSTKPLKGSDWFRMKRLQSAISMLLLRTSARCACVTFVSMASSVSLLRAISLLPSFQRRSWIH